MLERSGGTIAQSRLTYQHTVGAILAIGLLEDEETAYLYCETIDDLLLERTDGTLICIQVTSKDHGQPPFKAGDEKVLHTFTTFCNIESTRGDVQSYRFVASCGFFSERDNTQNLLHVLAIARETAPCDYDSHAKLRVFFRKLKQRLANGSIDALPTVVKKTDLQTGPPLPSARDTLYRTISSVLEDREPAPSCVDRILNRLVHRIEQAASQRFESGNITYIAAAKGEAGVAAEVLRIKRIDRKEVEDIVERELQLRPTDLQRGPRLANEAFPLLREKLTLNGASESAIVALQHSAFHAISKMRARQISDGTAAAGRLGASMRAIVSRFYANVYHELEASATFDARALYDAVDDRLPSLLERRKVDLPFVDEEELLGTLALLTNECHFWWGPRNDLDQLH